MLDAEFNSYHLTTIDLAEEEEDLEREQTISESG